MNNLQDQDILTISNTSHAEMKEALLRLHENRDFQKVILQGYFNAKAVDGVSLLATDYIKQNGLRAEVMEQLIAISQLQDYFNTIINLGPSTIEELEADEDDE